MKLEDLRKQVEKSKLPTAAKWWKGRKEFALSHGCNGHYWMGVVQVNALREAAELIAEIVREG